MVVIRDSYFRKKSEQCRIEIVELLNREFFSQTFSCRDGETNILTRKKKSKDNGTI